MRVSDRSNSADAERKKLPAAADTPDEFSCIVIGLVDSLEPASLAEVTGRGSIRS